MMFPGEVPVILGALLVAGIRRPRHLHAWNLSYERPHEGASRRCSRCGARQVYRRGKWLQAGKGRA